MKFKDAVKPISFLKAHAADVIKNLNETHGTMIITQHGEAKAVLQDIEEYDRIQQAMALLQRVAQGQIDYAQGKTIPAEKVLMELKQKIEQDFEK